MTLNDVSMSSTTDDADVDAKAKKGRTVYDLQRAKLDKLMKDPSKPVFIPEPRKDKDPNKAPDFVYNVRAPLKKFIKSS